MPPANRYSRSSVISDGWPDIFVTNDTDANGLYLNRGDGTFKTFSGPSGLYFIRLEAGDYNNVKKMILLK